MEHNSKSWFVNWFDSPYYDILYQHRDEKEAAFFIKNVVNFLEIPKNGKVLDLACGKGRHAFFLQKLGFEVMGLDLSKNKIKFAKEKYENDFLKFKVADMRENFGIKVDAILNLFTSFGYFESESENLKVLENIKKSMHPKAVGVLDYFNANFVEKNLVTYEEKKIGNLIFKIKRNITNQGFIEKEICLEDHGKILNYKEKVKNLQKEDFEKYFEKMGLKIKNIFGDYSLKNFNKKTSERCILIFGL